jgi:hypothetical protein
MIAVWAFPAFAALQCTSLEVSSSRNYGLPIKQTVTLTLHNAAASTAVIIKPGLTFYQFQDDLMLTRYRWRSGCAAGICIKPEIGGLKMHLLCQRKR